MDWIVSNQDLLISILVTFIIFFLGFVGIPYAKRNNWLNENDLKNTTTLFTLVKLIAKEFNPQTPFIDIVSDISSKVVDYVEQTMKLEDNALKKETAINTAIELLQILGYDIDNDKRKLIEILIESAVSYLPPTHE